MRDDHVPVNEDLGVTERDIASMKRLRRRHAIGKALLSSSVGFTAGFLPTALVAMEHSAQHSTYPYVSAAVAGGIQQEVERKSSRALYLFSIPFLLLGILAGLTLAVGSMATVTYYGVLSHR